MGELSLPPEATAAAEQSQPLPVEQPIGEEPQLATVEQLPVYPPNMEELIKADDPADKVRPQPAWDAFKNDVPNLPGPGNRS